MKNHKLEIIAFLSGCLVMILELVGSRILSPYFGNSIYIWTGMIGVILGFLSLGYYYGGIWADKNASNDNLSKVLWYAGICTYAIATFKEPILQTISSLTSGDIRSGSILSIIFLFGPVSTLLGCVTPVIVKLKLDSLNNVGKDIGKIYSLSTLGSITGTFLSGYLLIPNLGNTNLVYMVTVVLVGLSVWIKPNVDIKKNFTLLIMLGLYWLKNTYGLFQIPSIVDIDTTYNRIIIKNGLLNGKNARLFMTDRLGIQSAIYTDDNNLASEYTNSFASIAKLLPRTSKSLTIGGAGLAFPSFFIINNLGEKMDVVEIDPAMLDISKKYFFFNELSNLKIIHDDARNFIQKTNNTYELVFLDAFNSIAPPQHLTTDTFFKKLASKMTPDGTLVINLVTSISGHNSDLLTWQYSTIKEAFKDVSIYKINPKRQNNEVQNIIIVAKNYSENKINTFLLSKNMSLLDSSKMYDKNKILTDDYAPVEHLAGGYMGGL